MDRRTLAVLAVAALAVFAIGFSAATISSTVESGSGGGGAEGEDGPPPVLEEDAEVDSDASETASFLLDLLLALAALFLIGMYVYLAIRRPRLAAVLLVLILVVVAVVGVLGEFSLGFADEGEEPGEEDAARAGDGEGEGEGFDEGDGEGSGEESSTLDTSLALVAILSVVLILGAVLALRRGSDGTGAEEGEKPDEGVDSTTIGAIAGRAADRIEEDNETGTDAENEVYRAWREMTARLDADSGETTTPREFQQLAVETGMQPDDVRELTGLFERVRYGGADATEDREQRAVRVLRRVESTYGEDE